MRAKKQDDVLDVIYDSWYGLPLEEADKVVCDYVHRKLIPIEWIVKWAWAFMDKNSEGYKMAMELLHDWEKENDKETEEVHQ